VGVGVHQFCHYYYYYYYFFQTDNPFCRTLQYAISLGGDTDTISSMAGAIAGGYYGINMIDENFQEVAEGCRKIKSLANNL